jgi:hypothetical protein
MGKDRYRRQVGGNTTKGDRITIGHVSSNGDSVANARAKGCFGFNDPYGRHTREYWKKHRR